MEADHRLAEERRLLGVLRQVVEDRHAERSSRSRSCRSAPSTATRSQPRDIQSLAIVRTDARAEPGAPVLSASPSGVREKRRAVVLRQDAEVASVRIRRWSEGAWVPVGPASSSALFGPLARWSAKPSFAATYTMLGDPVAHGHLDELRVRRQRVCLFGHADGSSCRGLVVCGFHITGRRFRAVPGRGRGDRTFPCA